MDNFRIDVTADKQSDLEGALRICLTKHSYATHWCDHPSKGIVLFWSDPGQDLTAIIRYYKSKWHDEEGVQSIKKEPLRVNSFPFKIKTAEDLAKFVIGWLSEQEDSRYGPKDDIDGTIKKGFRLYNERYGRIDDCGDYSFVAIKPEWAEYHK